MERVRNKHLSLAMVLCAGTFAALSGAAASAVSGASVSVTLQPNRAGAHSTVHALVQGSQSESSSSLPSSIALLVARGFRVDPRATKGKCHPSGTSPCPADSKIGSGEAIAHVTTSVGVGSGDYDVPFKLFLGKPQQAGDIASVVVQGSLEGRSFTTSGRLFAPSSGPYGLELEMKVPPVSPPAGISVTGYLKKLTLTAGVKRKVRKGKKRHRRTYALITNPGSCTGGNWAGELVVTLSDGSSQSFSFTAPCRAR